MGKGPSSPDSASGPPAWAAVPSEGQPEPHQQNYRLVASHEYQSQREDYRMAAELMAQYGRWLVATITAVHFGSIYLLSSLPGDNLEGRQAALWALVTGVILILLCGLAAWANWGAMADLKRNWADARMLVDPKAWPKADAETRWVRWWVQWSLRASLAFGVLSVACIPLAAYLLVGSPW